MASILVAWARICCASTWKPSLIAGPPQLLREPLLDHAARRRTRPHRLVDDLPAELGRLAPSGAQGGEHGPRDDVGGDALDALREPNIDHYAAGVDGHLDQPVAVDGADPQVAQPVGHGLG